MRHLVRCGVVVLGLVSAASRADAQAWVEAKGSLGVGVDYNLGISSKVIPDEGDDFDDAGTTSHQFTIAADYVPLPRLSVGASLPLAVLKYTGDQARYPHPGGGRYDDGDHHATLTDLRVGARYQLLEEPFALTPHLAFSIPVADYETVGNTVGGRGLKALHAGISVGRFLGDATYVHLTYEFSLLEKYDRTPETAQHSQNRSDAALMVGHALLNYGLDLNLAANMRRAHGGVNFSDFPALSANEILYHDAILAENILLVGGGLGYQISDSLNATLAVRVFVAGSNTQNASVFALGLGWSRN